MHPDALPARRAAPPRLAFLVAACAGAVLVACGGDGNGGGTGTPSGSGTLNLSLADAPACGYD